MSEKGNNEEVILHHFDHEHPLILTEEDGRGYNSCNCCWRFTIFGEKIYRCRDNCDDPITFHEECAEMPREITLSVHPQHSLIQEYVPYDLKCAFCQEAMGRIGYECSSSDSCEFQTHLGCAWSMGVVAAGERSCIKHPSHPHHELTQMWGPVRAASLRCDACGAIHRGNSYICTVCQYCIIDSCAALPATVEVVHLHRHPLSLSYRLPLEYIKYRFKCDVCFKDLNPKYWVYHCELCRYVAHINCATTASPLIMSNMDPDVIAFPINDVAEELIGPFVTKLGVTVTSNDNEIIKGKYKFHNPDHQLRLISTSLHDQEGEEEKDDDDDDDDDDDADINYGIISKLVCDGCTAPISSSNKYISCGDCKYFLHLACFQLPPELPSHPLHQEPDHILILQTRPKLDFVRCNICYFHTNGLFYECKGCSFKVDIKCVSLPDTINHAAHPHRHLNLFTRQMTWELSYFQLMCRVCGYETYAKVCYRCDVCQIILHSKCALLPAEVINPRWDKHPLPLTFNARFTHPSDFYCEVCEQQMNPTLWMYHCRDCDVSIHPHCLPAASGEFRNFKFGQQYNVGALHQHPVVHQLTNKLRCDVCSKRKVHGDRGFQCASPSCDFFMCYKHHKHDMHAID